jgi:hypothetical protein
VKKINLYLITLIIVSCTFYLYAMRKPPSRVPYIIFNGVEYRAEVDRSIPIGCVQAVQPETGRKLWWKQIYVIKYNSDLETDVQDVFIKKMQPKDGKLLIENERGGTYLLDVNSLEVKCLTGKPVTSGFVP